MLDDLWVTEGGVGFRERNTKQLGVLLLAGSHWIERAGSPRHPPVWPVVPDDLAMKHVVLLLDHGELRALALRRFAGAFQFPRQLSDDVLCRDLQRVRCWIFIRRGGFLLRFGAERASRRRFAGRHNSREYP